MPCGLRHLLWRGGDSHLIELKGISCRSNGTLTLIPGLSYGVALCLAESVAREDRGDAATQLDDLGGDWLCKVASGPEFLSLRWDDDEEAHLPQVILNKGNL